MSDAKADDLIGREDACRLLEVAEPQLDAMIDEGLLSPVTGAQPQGFYRSQVIALREAGG